MITQIIQKLFVCVTDVRAIEKLSPDLSNNSQPTAIFTNVPLLGASTVLPSKAL